MFFFAISSSIATLFSIRSRSAIIRDCSFLNLVRAATIVWAASAKTLGHPWVGRPGALVRLFENELFQLVCGSSHTDTRSARFPPMMSIKWWCMSRHCCSVIWLYWSGPIPSYIKSLSLIIDLHPIHQSTSISVIEEVEVLVALKDCTSYHSRMSAHLLGLDRTDLGGVESKKTENIGFKANSG